MKYDLIIFDFDGTLMDTNDIIVESLNEASLEFRKQSITKEEYEKILGKPLAQQMLDLDPEKAVAMEEFYRTYYRTHQKARVVVFEGVYELLDGLMAKGIKCAILTNKGRNGLLSGLEQYNLNPYFEHYLSAQDVTHAKPNPEGIHTLCDYFGISEKRTLMVGDSGHDIEAGINAGIDTCLVQWTILDINKLKRLNPTYIIKTPGEIHYIIDEKQL